MSNFEITKNFVASTGHVTEKDMNLLVRSGVNDPMCAYDLPYGALVALGDPAEREERCREALAYGYSVAFIGLVKLAGEQGCGYLLLDQDGPIYDGLPTFDW